MQYRIINNVSLAPLRPGDGQGHKNQPATRDTIPSHARQL